MPRLIDADMLEPSEVYMNYGFTRIVYMDDIDKMPTVDVESLIAKHEDIGYERGCRDGYAEALEVTDDAEKHGHWTSSQELAEYGECQCTVCRTVYYEDDLCNVGKTGGDGLPNYCPNCGARMDE